MAVLRSVRATEGCHDSGLNDRTLENFCPGEMRTLGWVSRVGRGCVEHVGSWAVAAADGIRQEPVDRHRMSLTEVADTVLGDTPLGLDLCVIYVEKRDEGQASSCNAHRGWCRIE